MRVGPDSGGLATLCLLPPFSAPILPACAATVFWDRMRISPISQNFVVGYKATVVIYAEHVLPINYE
jgi:hypothetical protein